MKPKISDYSVHFRDLSRKKAAENASSMVKRIEAFRLRLDLEKILPWIKGPDVLDFPIGTGRFYPNLVGRFNVFGYDIAPLYIEAAQQAHPTIADHFATFSLEEVGHERSFDTVATLRTLNNIENLQVAIGNVARILKPGGRWIFNYPPEGRNFAVLKDWLEQAGLTVIHRERYDFHTAMKSMTRIELALYGRFRNLIERGWVPYSVFRLLEAVVRWRGTYLFICEKRS
jgi:2-polyprenyl-3-methyl-5-hydroxy-6-metoxy-1,4-benzoquinol methylase